MLKNITLAVIALFVVIRFIYFGTKPNVANAPKESVPIDLNQQLEATTSEMSARAIAEKSCIKGGETLKANGYYNENSKTWWFDANLNATKPGCNPACVVSVETKTVEINWRCNGIKP